MVGGRRCLLTYQPLGLPEAPCPWHVVNFPSPASVSDCKQRRITEDLLRVVGLQLEQRADKVFATRRQKCKVFWALSQQLEGVEEPPPNMLYRDQETPIFDFNEFCTGGYGCHIVPRGWFSCPAWFGAHGSIQTLPAPLFPQAHPKTELCFASQS